MNIADGENDMIKDYSANVVLVEPLATIAAIEDFLLPKIKRDAASKEEIEKEKEDKEKASKEKEVEKEKEKEKSEDKDDKSKKTQKKKAKKGEEETKKPKEKSLDEEKPGEVQHRILIPLVLKLTSC